MEKSEAAGKVEEIIELLPGEILVEEKMNVRRWTSSDAGASEAEVKRVEQLANSIERTGQLDFGRVVPKKIRGDNGEDAERFFLVAGHRRRKAIALINERRSSAGQSLLKMKLIVDRSGHDPKQMAAHSNIHREDNNPMDVALLMDDVRQEHGWGDDMAGAKQVSKYLGVSLPHVNQHLRFLKADPRVQQLLSQGRMSARTANSFLSSTKPEKIAEVLEKAEGIQVELDAAQEKRNEEFIQGHGSKEQRAELKKSREAKGKKADGAAEAEATEAKPKSTRRLKPEALVKAIDETEGARAQERVKTRKDILSWFEEIADGPAYGEESGPVRQFCRYFVDQWVTGKGTDKTLMSKFDAMTGTDVASKKQNEKAASDKQAEEDAVKAEKKAAKKQKKVKADKPVKEKKEKKTRAAAKPVKSAKGKRAATA